MVKSSNLIDVFKNGNIVIPIYFLKNYKKFQLEAEEFIMLMYFYNCGDNCTFNPERICNDLGYELSVVMEYIDSLTNKGFISVDVKKNEKGYMEDILTIDGFYNKLKLFVIEEINESSSVATSSSIYDLIEEEFGRTLSSIEYEIIKAWLENNISEDLIKEAVKEAVFNGVSNLKYIDKILYEWGKKGINTVKDVENNRMRRNAVRDRNLDKNDIDMDIVEWNWFDDYE